MPCIGSLSLRFQRIVCSFQAKVLERLEPNPLAPYVVEKQISTEEQTAALKPQT